MALSSVNTPATTTPATNFNPAPQCLGQASGSTTGTVLQGGALPPITTTQKTAQSAPGFYMCYLNTLANQAKAGGASATTAGPIQTQGLQTQAFNQASQNAGAYQPNLSAAGTTAMGVAGSCISQMAQNYMNPYTKCVVNAIGNLGQANIAQNLAPQATAGIVGSGQFGSQRGAGALGQVLANADLGITGQQACALQKGYAQALCTAKAQTANQLNAGKLLGCLANVQSNLNIACTANLAKLGQCQYTIAQNSALYPLSVAKAESCIMRGYTVPMATSCIKTAPIPGAYATSPLAQVAGLGSLASGILGKCGIASLGSLFSCSPNKPTNVPQGYAYDPTTQTWTNPGANAVFNKDGTLNTSSSSGSSSSGVSGTNPLPISPVTPPENPNPPLTPTTPTSSGTYGNGCCCTVGP